MPFFDPLYFLFLLPGLLFAMWAQRHVRLTYIKYSAIGTRSGITGIAAANGLIQRYGLNSISLAQIPGDLSDNYNPTSKTMALSASSMRNSIAAVAIVAHELGHALQDKSDYLPLRLRAAIIPAVQVGAWLAPVMITAGAIFASSNLIELGIIAFGVTAAFALITLPVELDASSKAMRMLDESGFLAGDELAGARQVLNAAALTYVAAAAQALLQLTYFITRFGTGRRRRL